MDSTELRHPGPAGDGARATFALMSFNQEEFIEEALEAALAQTYPGLEIIVSDDCSTDGTATRIRRIVDAYTGPHSVVVNVNERNLGIGKHVNLIVRMARGRILVLAAGDDISAPDRTAKVMDHWDSSHPRPSAVFCGARLISRNGELLGRVEPAIARSRPTEDLILFKGLRRTLVLGACGAYDLDLFRSFGDLDPDLPIEDIPLLIRASMSNGVSYLAHDLVDYRHDSSVWKPVRKEAESRADRHRRRRLYTEARLKAARQVLKDTHKKGDPSCIAAARKAYALHEYVHQTCIQGRFSPRRMLATCLRTGHWLYPVASTFVDAFPRTYSLALRVVRPLTRTTRATPARKGKAR